MGMPIYPRQRKVHLTWNRLVPTPCCSAVAMKGVTLEEFERVEQEHACRNCEKQARAFRAAERRTRAQLGLNRS